MNELIKQVTPLTAGIIWFVKDETQVNSTTYKEIDYLLDGLFTANLKVSPITSSRVIVGQNFHRSIYVMIIKEPKTSEIESYLSLFKKDLTPESDVIVIDELDKMKDLRKEFKDISNNLRTISL